MMTSAELAVSKRTGKDIEVFDRDADRLVAFFSTRALGEMLSHQLIASVISAEYPSQRYYSVVSHAIGETRRRHGRCIDTVQGRGYVLLHLHDKRRHAAKFVDQGKRRFSIAEEVLNTITTGGAEGRLVAKSKAAIATLVTVADELKTSLMRDKCAEITKEVERVNKRIDQMKAAEAAIDDVKAVIRERDILKSMKRKLERGHAV